MSYLVNPYMVIASSDYPDGLGTDGDGTCTNVTENTTDQKLGDGCYAFNASSSKVEIADMLAESVFTISCWIQTGAVGSNQSIFGNTDATNGMNLYLHSTGKLRCSEESTGTQLISSSTLVKDTWYNVIITKTSGGTVTMYIDNVQEDQETDWIDLTGGSTSELGSDQGDYWNGYLDEFACWNVVISSSLRGEIYPDSSGAEISSLSDKDGILVYFNMDEIVSGTAENIAIP